MLVGLANFGKKYVVTTRFFPVYLWGFYGMNMLIKIIKNLDRFGKKNDCFRKLQYLITKIIYMKKLLIAQ